MGGAAAIQLAHDHPDRVLGVICRDGVAAENWKIRRGILARALGPISPDLGSALEILLGFTVELPQLALSRWRSLSVTAGPDIRNNMRAGSITLPYAAMLLGSDLTPVTTELGRRGDIPVMPVWGNLDLAIPVSTGREIARLLGEELIVVPGTHCWMLANPRTQVALLRTRRGRVFLDRVAARASILGAPFPLAA
jgi:pimeloyl-ACP methyl ester carboxylesterase